MEIHFEKLSKVSKKLSLLYYNSRKNIFTEISNEGFAFLDIMKFTEILILAEKKKL